MTDTVSDTEDTRTFHGFGDLPYDLRLQIWKYAIFGAQRTFEIHKIWWLRNKDIPALPAPSAALACSDARHIAHSITSVNRNGYTMTDKKRHRNRLRFLLPLDILYLPTTLEWSYFQSKTLSQIFQQRRNISVRWDLTVFEERERELPSRHKARLEDFIHQWDFLADAKEMDTLMVDFTPTGRHHLTDPSYFEVIVSRTGDYIFPEHPGTRHPRSRAELRTVDIFDKTVDEIAKTTDMLRERDYKHHNFTCSLFAEICDGHMYRIINLREKWKDVEPMIRRAWIGICKYRVLKKHDSGSRWPDREALRLAMSPDHDQDWTRRILETGPTFKAVLTLSSLVQPILAREAACLAETDRQTEPPNGSERRIETVGDGHEDGLERNVVLAAILADKRNKAMLADIARLDAMQRRLDEASSEIATLEKHIKESYGIDRRFGICSGGQALMEMAISTTTPSIERHVIHQSCQH